MWDWLNIEKPLRWLMRHMWAGSRQIRTLRPVWAIEEDTVSKRQEPWVWWHMPKVSTHSGSWGPKRECSICFQPAVQPCFQNLELEQWIQCLPMPAGLKSHHQHLHPKQENRGPAKGLVLPPAPAALAGLQQWEKKSLNNEQRPEPTICWHWAEQSSRVGEIWKAVSGMCWGKGSPRRKKTRSISYKGQKSVLSNLYLPHIWQRINI